MDARKILLYVVYVVVLIALVGGIFYGFNHESGDETAQKTPGDSIAKTNPDVSKAQEAKKPATSQKTDNPAKTPTSQPQQPTASANQQLVNTGPGEAVALFAVASVVGMATFSVYQRKSL